VVDADSRLKELKTPAEAMTPIIAADAMVEKAYP